MFCSAYASVHGYDNKTWGFIYVHRFDMYKCIISSSILHAKQVLLVVDGIAMKEAKRLFLSLNMLLIPH